MDIKLHARLCAYTKLDNTFPIVKEGDAGKFVGVGLDNKYTLFDNAKSAEVNTLFTDEKPEISDAGKSLLDSLF